LLHLLRKQLVSRGKTVFFFESAADFNRESVITFVRTLARKSKEEAYFFVDETQDNTASALFVLLLKNTTGHRITTIGAGVPEFHRALVFEFASNAC
jgi:hypothetical protein